MRVIAPFLVIALLFSFGCTQAVKGDVVKTLEVQKVVAVQIMTATVAIHKQGQISDATFKKIADAYTKWRVTHLLVVEGLIELNGTVTEERKIEIEQLLQKLPFLLESLKSLADAYGINYGGVK